MSTISWRAPFFILGNPRSGTSLLRIMLDSNPKLVVPPECGLIEWLYASYRNWEYPVHLDAFLEDLYNARKFETWNVSQELLKAEILRIKPQTYQNLCQLIYFTYAKTINKTPDVWGDKNNYFIHRLNKINGIYPNAKYIHLVRDGRDVSVSYREVHTSQYKSKYKPNLPYSIQEIASEWQKNLSNIDLFFKSLPSDRHITIGYEELLKNNDKTLLHISNFLEVPYDKKMRNYHERNKNLLIEPKETLEWKSKTVQEIDTSRIGRYKEHLLEQEINQFNLIAYQQLIKFGYL